MAAFGTNSSITTQSEISDCYLRQGDGGTKTAHFGFKTCFLRRFHNRSVSFFGQKTQEHDKTIEKRCLEAKIDFFHKKCWPTWAFLISLHLEYGRGVRRVHPSTCASDDSVLLRRVSLRKKNFIKPSIKPNLKPSIKPL